jgi:hypothetical protein
MKILLATAALFDEDRRTTDERTDGRGHVTKIMVSSGANLLSRLKTDTFISYLDM